MSGENPDNATVCSRMEAIMQAFIGRIVILLIGVYLLLDSGNEPIWRVVGLLMIGYVAWRTYRLYFRSP